MSDTTRPTDQYEHIFIMDVNEDGEAVSEFDEDYCWCQDDINDNGRKYIREDIVDRQVVAQRTEMIACLRDKALAEKHLRHMMGGLSNTFVESCAKCRAARNYVKKIDKQAKEEMACLTKIEK